LERGCIMSKELPVDLVRRRLLNAGVGAAVPALALAWAGVPVQAQESPAIIPGSRIVTTTQASKIAWSEEVWKAINRAVHEETMRVRVGAQFLPQRVVVPKTTSVAADSIANVALDEGSQKTLAIDESATIRLNEIWAEFALTTQQVHETAQAKNPEHTSAVALARCAARYLSLAQDLILFQGLGGYQAPFFVQNIRAAADSQRPKDYGLLSLNTNTLKPQGPFGSPNRYIPVPRLTEGHAPGVLWGENTLTAVAAGYSVLTAQGHPGPYALILQTIPYADLFAPVGIGSVAIAADQIRPLVKAGLFGTGALPPDSPVPVVPPAPAPPPAAPYFGVLMSVGGDTMELVVAQHAKTVFLQQDIHQNWRFRVLERFALRVTDPSAIVPLVFQ